MTTKQPEVGEPHERGVLGYQGGFLGWVFPNGHFRTLNEPEVDSLNRLMAGNTHAQQPQLRDAAQVIVDYAKGHDMRCEDGVTFKPVAMVLIHDLIAALQTGEGA